MFISFLLAGCATRVSHGVTAYPHQRLRIAVLPVQSEVEIKRLKDIETVPESTKEISDEEERIRQQMQKVTEDMTRSMETRLNASPYFEVVPHEQVDEGAVVGGATKNIWIGLAVALEEIGQEVLTWGGGSYLFNMYYAPVTIEGELISTMDGQRVWSHTTFDSIDRKALKKLPEEERKKKEIQLEVTAEKAEKDLMENLEKAAKNNLWKESLDVAK